MKKQGEHYTHEPKEFETRYRRKLAKSKALFAKVDSTNKDVKR